MLKDVVFKKLLSRMAARGDVPSLQYSADRLIQTLQSEQTHVADMTPLVLSDPALTQKVIRLANSAMYNATGGDVTTVSRAIMVLGVDAVEYLGLGLQLLSQFQSAVGSREDARVALKRALVAAEFTRSMTSECGSHLSEEAAVCTLMYPLARLLVILYLEDEWAQIQARLADDASLSENAACQQVLGVTFDEIAEQAAEHWGLPTKIRYSMRARLPEPDSIPQSHEDWIGAIVSISSCVASMMESDASDEEISRFVLQYTDSLVLEGSNVQDALDMARASEQAVEASDVSLTSLDEPMFGKPRDAEARLAAALGEVHAKAPQLSASALVPWVVESIMNVLNLKEGFMMLLDPKSGRYEARFGLGPGVHERLSRLSCDARFVPDIFHLVATKGVPILFADVEDPGVKHRIPVWFTNEFPDAGSILLVPVCLHGRCLAMLCASWGEELCTQGLTPGEARSLSAFAEEISRCFARSG